MDTANSLFSTARVVLVVLTCHLTKHLSFQLFRHHLLIARTYRQLQLADLDVMDCKSSDLCSIYYK